MEADAMTMQEEIVRALGTGPKTLTWIEAHCAPARRPGERRRDPTGILAWMVSEGTVEVQEWVVEKGRFVPVYRLRRRAL